MQLKSVIDSPCGIRFMIDTLPLHSGFGRKRLLERPMMTGAGEIRAEYGRVEAVYRTFVQDASRAPLRRRLGARLMTLRDISGTVARLRGGSVLDEVELFEVKNLSLLAGQVRDLLSQAEFTGAGVPDTDAVLVLLDPEGTRIPSFYVYDAYSPRLRELRAELRKLGGYGSETGVAPERAEDGKESAGAVRIRRAELTEQAKELEREIRERLSGELRPYAGALQETLDALADLDIRLSKAVQIAEAGLCLPEVSADGRTVYRGMFHPRVKAALAGKGKAYMPVDIAFGEEAVSVIGANMGGKTVALKTVALCQYLFQFGFGLPAQSACVDIKQDVALCVGDGQDEAGGLSSFAAEIAAIDAVIRRVRGGEYLLALIDEPARTTNPVEGTALVEALLEELAGKRLSLLLTTHYHIAGEGFRRLRVRGLIDGEMDYRLVEAGAGDVPREAVRIARKLGADPRWIDRAETLLGGQ